MVFRGEEKAAENCGGGAQTREVVEGCTGTSGIAEGCTRGVPPLPKARIWNQWQDLPVQSCPCPTGSFDCEVLRLRCFWIPEGRWHIGGGGIVCACHENEEGSAGLEGSVVHSGRRF